MKTLKAIYPLIVTNKIKECGEFYTNVLGFRLVFDQDWYIQLLHEQSGVELAFMIPNAENQPTFLHPKFQGEGIIISLEVENAKEEYEHISAIESVAIELAYTEEEWGQKHFILRDPSGAYIDIVEQAEQP